MLKKIILISLTNLLIFHTQLSFSENDIGKSINANLDQTAMYLQTDKDTSKAWESLIIVSQIIKQHPDYDDGEYAEGIIDMVTSILTKPWQDISPYLTGKKGTPFFHDFLINHVNELSTSSDLNKIKSNILKHCDLKKFPTCRKLIQKINAVTNQ